MYISVCLTYVLICAQDEDSDSLAAAAKEQKLVLALGPRPYDGNSKLFITGLEQIFGGNTFLTIETKLHNMTT